MFKPLAFVLTLMLAPLAGAEVLRCADAAGNVSYTDGACPAGASPVGRVTLPPPSSPDRPAAELERERAQDAAILRARPLQGPSAPLAAQPAPAPSGPAIIDSRGAPPNGAAPPAAESRWSDRGGEPGLVIDDGYGYPGAYRPPPARDLRPRLRNCDGAGCRDTLGNHYDRAGQVDRYRGADGRTCQPIGTTTVCR